MNFNLLLASRLVFVLLPDYAVARASCEINGLCFVQNPVANSLSEVGFAFPRSQPGVDSEMLVSMKVELPYGYAGFVPAQGAEQTLRRASSGQSSTNLTGFRSAAFSIDFVSKETQLEDPTVVAAVEPDDFVVQVSKMLPNQTFAPTGASGISVSQDVFFINTSFYQLITRFQGAAMRELGVSPDQVSAVTFINSNTLPTYINNATPPAALFDGSPAAIDTAFEFEFDGRSAQFENYTEMLKVAGFV